MSVVHRSPLQIALYRLMHNRMAVLGMAVAGTLFLLAILAPWLPVPAQDRQNLSYGAQSPSAQHWLGTDLLGRDQLSRILYGARISLAVGVAATLVSLFIGVTYGSIAGYVGGRVDNVMMRLVDILYGLPWMFLVIILLVIAGQKIINLFIALGAVQWLTMSRIVRGQVLSIKEKEYVEAARALGCGNAQIIARHVLPNVIGPVIVYTTLMVPAVILEESFLSFLGLGVPDPYASLGKLANEGARAMESYPWMLLFPGLVLMAILFSLNFIGDGLRDALDPQLKK